MQTDIVQAAAVVIAGNRFLRGSRRDEPPLAPTTLQFCESVGFATFDGPPHAPALIPYAADPAQWFARLAREGVVGLRLHYQPGPDPRKDRMNVGSFGGGGRWLIEVVRRATSEAWESRWLPGDPDHPEQRVWRVTYGRVATGIPHLRVEERGLATLRRELEEVLPRIADFADRQGLDGFARSFRGGLERLRSPDPLAAVYHHDLDPGGSLPLEARQLLAAAQEAWVFGGMGSWNDLGFSGPDEETYQELSDRLFGLLTAAAEEAASTSFAGFSPPEARRPWWKPW